MRNILLFRPTLVNKQKRMFALRTGRVARAADRNILSMLSLGRNKRILPSTPRYAFMPSNS